MRGEVCILVMLPCTPAAAHYFSVPAPACRPATRSSRYCVSKGTGRPVAPFLSPVSHAAPAMSRCAHWNFLVKRERKQAAVMVLLSCLSLLVLFVFWVLCWFCLSFFCGCFL